MLKKIADLYVTVAAVVKQYPAVVSWGLTMGVTLLARFGFHVSATALAVIVGVAVTVLHTWLHRQTRKPPA